MAPPIRPLRLLTAAVLAVSGWFVPLPALGAAFDRDTKYAVEVNGSSVDAKVFVRSGRLLVQIPWESKLFLVERETAFAIREEDARIEQDGKRAVFGERFAWSVPVRNERCGWVFRIEEKQKEVRILGPETMWDDCPPVIKKAPDTNDKGSGSPGVPAPAPAVVPEAAAPVSTATMAAGAPPAAGTAATNATASRASAIDCLSLESRPATGVPGCSRFIFVRNSCEAPVLALLQRTEHLMTGTLPQSFDTVVPPGEQWLGCAWWSGAMAPAQHELLGAYYLQPPGKVADGRHGRPPRR